MTKTRKTYSCRMVLGLCLMACFAVHARAQGNDTNHKSGALIISTGTIGASRFSYFLYYRKLPSNSSCSAASADTGTIQLKQSIWSGRPNDFSGHENGQVEVVHLEPGAYEICNYDVQYFVGPGYHIWSPPKGFSIAFSIRPQESTYIGDFAFIGKERKALLGGTVPAGAILVVSDKRERDIPIALKQEPGLQPITIQVTDVSGLNEPDVLTTEPAGPVGVTEPEGKPN